MSASQAACPNHLNPISRRCHYDSEKSCQRIREPCFGACRACCDDSLRRFRWNFRRGSPACHGRRRPYRRWWTLRRRCAGGWRNTFRRRTPLRRWCPLRRRCPLRPGSAQGRDCAKQEPLAHPKLRSRTARPDGLAERGFTPASQPPRTGIFADTTPVSVVCFAISFQWRGGERKSADCPASGIRHLGRRADQAKNEELQVLA